MSERLANDLLILAADRSIGRVARELLHRPDALKIQRNVAFAVTVASGGHDSGVRARASEILRRHLRSYRYALVMFDKDGCGHEHLSREQIQRDVEAELFINGWKDRAKVIVIDPELEMWAWQASNAVSQLLGWDGSYAALRTWLRGQKLWNAGAAKPHAPKAAMEQALSVGRRSTRRKVFTELASTVSVRGCTDPAFNEFTATLQAWFPRQRAGSGMVVRERAPVYEAGVLARAVG